MAGPGQGGVGGRPPDCAFPVCADTQECQNAPVRGGARCGGDTPAELLKQAQELGAQTFGEQPGWGPHRTQAASLRAQACTPGKAGSQADTRDS